MIVVGPTLSTERSQQKHALEEAGQTAKFLELAVVIRGSPKPPQGDYSLCSPP